MPASMRPKLLRSHRPPDRAAVGRQKIRRNATLRGSGAAAAAERCRLSANGGDRPPVPLSLFFPGAQEPSDHDQLAEVIGVVVGDQQRLA
jgi:hypothetical protein